MAQERPARPKDTTLIPGLNKIYQGDCIETMRTWPDGFVNTCVTSPPYFGLRDYGVAGQIGLEETPEEYVAKLIEVFHEVRRVLRDDATLWLNLGDSYASNTKGSGGQSAKQDSNGGSIFESRKFNHGVKQKDLIGIPWMVAFALRADGWYLRQDIIWAKPNPMPESVTDRCTKAHEYIFMLSKSSRYYYDQETIKEKMSLSSEARLAQDIEGQAGSERANGGAKTNGPMKAVGGDKQRGHGRRHAGFNDRWDKMEREEQCSGMRNKRSVWTVGTKPFTDAHFATFPPDLIAPCVLAGAHRGGCVLDPFMGAGTTALVAATHDRKFIGCELNQQYIDIAQKRIASETAQGKMF